MTVPIAAMSNGTPLHRPYRSRRPFVAMPSREANDGAPARAESFAPNGTRGGGAREAAGDDDDGSRGGEGGTRRCGASTRAVRRGGDARLRGSADVGVEGRPVFESSGRVLFWIRLGLVGGRRECLGMPRGPPRPHPEGCGRVFGGDTGTGRLRARPSAAPRLRLAIPVEVFFVGYRRASRSLRLAWWFRWSCFS